MDSQLFFILNLVVAVALTLWFLSGRKGNSKVSSLDLKKGEFFPKEEAPVELKKQAVPVKQLNVLFMYNGHDWDAFEVLGLPAGCSFKMVTQRFQELIRDADQGKLEFYQAAYEAILKKQ